VCTMIGEIWNMEKTGVHNHNILSGVRREIDDLILFK